MRFNYIISIWNMRCYFIFLIFVGVSVFRKSRIIDFLIFTVVLTLIVESERTYIAFVMGCRFKKYRCEPISF